jgi:hypothetical protein
MTKTYKKNRFAAILLTIAMMIGMISAVGVTSASAVTDKVSLYSSNISFSKYGARTFETYIQTRDNAANQEVYVHYCYMDNQPWQDAKAEYVTTLSDGSKIWKANFSSFNTKYAIKYVTDGQEIWDNNNGKDYTYADVCGTAPVTVERTGYAYYNIPVRAVLQNYAYNKNVFVRYTTDGWKSFKDQKLTYSSTNANGTENWTTTVYDATNSNIKYAVCYQVNGTEFWANNFGANYDGTYYIHR